jgi:KaiC/GvpD/RAD55 family RecA-like ATPase
MGEVVQMLDFNDAPRQVTWDTSYTAKDVAEAIERDIERYVLYIFPNANIERGKDARIGNLDGDPGGSLSISLKPEDAGQWMDHNTKQAGNALQLWEQVEGVSGGEAVRQVAQWLGWSEQPLQRSEKAKERATKPKVEQGPLPPPTAVWTYTDADGKPLVLVRRYDLENGDKTYRPHDIVAGKAGMPKVRPLYNLQGIAGSDTVYVVEGEKCADHLIAQGFATTTMIGGANADTKKTDWSPLQGKKIILWRDNDEAGERWQQSLQFLKPAGAVEIPKDKPKGWDCADATVQEIGDLIALVQKIPDAPGLIEPQASKFAVEYFTGTEVSDDGSFDFVEDLLCDGQMSVLYGPSNTGKSFFAVDLAMHVATGATWRDKEVEQGAVIYCALEGRNGVKRRVAAFNKHYGLESGAPFGIVACDINLLDAEADVSGLIEAVNNEAKNLGQPVRLIVIDTLSRAFAGGNENASEDMGKLVSNVDKIRAQTSTHMLIVHHSGKDATKGARGSSVLRAATDTEIEISKDKDVAVVEVKKQRDMESGQSWAFDLKGVRVGTNRRGKAITSCVVVEEEVPAKPERTARRKPRGKHQGVLFGCLELCLEGPHAFKMTSEGLPNCKAVTVDVLQEQFYRKYVGEARKRSDCFNAAMEGLLENQFINKDGEKVWKI